MSPQPAAPPKAPEADKPAEATRLHDALLTRIEDKLAAIEDGDTDVKLTSGEKQIARALRLENERADSMKRIAANREYLRLMDDNEELEDDEADWLADFYPEKEKGQTRSDDEIERTRKVKAAARSK